MIEVELPDGTIAEFPAGTSQDVMRAALQKRFGKPQAAAQPERGIGQRLYDNIIGDPNDGVDSFGERAGRTVNDAVSAAGAGVSRGITGLADLPGAAFGLGADAGNWVARQTGLTDERGAQDARQLVSDFAAPRVGSGSTMRDAAASATGGATEFRGNTTPGRYAGTVGEFLPGAMAGGGGMMRNALAFGAIPGIASEAAGQLTEGTAAEPWARALAPIAAGSIAGGLTRPKGPQAPTGEALSQQADDLYRAGASRPAANQQSVQALRGQIDQSLQDLNIKTPTGRVVADGNVKKFLDVLEDFDGQQMTPDQMQTVRRILTDAAGSPDASDRRIGAELLDKFDDWRNAAVPEYAQADKLYGRTKRAQDVEFRIEKAERRAASSGTGGNSVNTTRQNIRQILDNPKARRGYSAEEIEAMEAIVRGSPTVNALRWAGRFSPDAGFFPGLAGLGSVAGATQIGPLALAPSIIGYIAKGGAEVATNKQINALSGLIRNGGPLPQNVLAQMDNATLALLAARSANSGGRSSTRE